MTAPGMLNGLAFGAGTYVAVGDGGTIVQLVSPATPDAPILSGAMTERGFELSFIAEAGVSYTIQLVPAVGTGGWEDLVTLTNKQGPTSFVDPGSSNRAAGFYRVEALAQ